MRMVGSHCFSLIMWKMSWVVLGIAPARLLQLHMMLVCCFERIDGLLEINWGILRLLARLCIWRVPRGLTSLFLWASWVGLCQNREMLIGMRLRELCATWKALRAIGLTTPGIRGYWRVIVTQNGYFMLRLRPQVVMFLHLVVALFLGSFASRPS